MNNLILVRHGQSQWNQKKKFTGWVDIDLTEQGKSEAESAGKLIKELNIEFDAYFTSIQKRAINTLKIILDTLQKKNSEIKKAWELNERHYGALTGYNKDEIIKNMEVSKSRSGEEVLTFLHHRWTHNILTKKIFI